MDGRFSARIGGVLIVAALALAGCEQGAGGMGSSGDTASASAVERSRAPTEAERLLDQRSRAMQRTVLEASGAGAALGGTSALAWGLGPALIASLAGGAAGASAGTYVGTLQQDYANDEQRLDRMITDLETANADAEATLVAMRRVLDEQLAEIAAIRASISKDASAESLLKAELDSLQENVKVMEAAISGADERLEDVRAARNVLAPDQAGARVDPRLGELSRRIAAMREIATTLSQGA